jgi:hypothetical protein
MLPSSQTSSNLFFFSKRAYDRQITGRSQHGERLSQFVYKKSRLIAEAALLPAAHLVAALNAPGEGELHLLQLVEMPMIEEGRKLACIRLT